MVSLKLEIEIEDEKWRKIMRTLRQEYGVELVESKIKEIVETNAYNWIMKEYAYLWFKGRW